MGGFRLFPDEYADSAYSIDFQKYYDKGYRGLILDVDNTLVEHGAPCDERSQAFFEDVRIIGFKTCIVSNNDEPRIKPFADKAGSDYVYKAGKPKKSGYMKAMQKTGTDVSHTMFIGDQIFTDIWGARRCGIYCILVRYIKFDREIQIVLKRIIEKPVLLFYKIHTKRH